MYIGNSLKYFDTNYLLTRNGTIFNYKSYRPHEVKIKKGVFKFHKLVYFKYERTINLVTDNKSIKCFIKDFIERSEGSIYLSDLKTLFELKLAV